MAKTKTISWPLAPAPESMEHVRISEQYELYQRQMAEAEEREVLRHDRPGQ